MRFLADPLRSYWSFIRTHTRFAAFGFLLTLASSFGQTFFIAIFNDNLRGAFDLSHGGFGMLYSLATFASGLTMLWAGSLIDRVNLRAMTVVVCIGMLAACALMASAAGVVMLAVAIYMLRVNGQGLLGHISITSMARYFEKERGKAISVASLGYPAGEAAFPILAVALLAAIGWRASWVVIAGVLALTLVPAVLWLLLGHDDRHRAHVEARRDAEVQERERAASVDPAQRHVGRSWRPREVLRDVRFYMLLPAVLSPAFIVTGVFFHQVQLITEKGWEKAWFAACFAGFAAAQLFSTLIVGELIDRFGSRIVFPFFLVPLAIGLGVLTFVDHAVAALLFLVFAGFTSGTVGPVVGALWAELYGVKFIGSIRAIAMALMVFSTAGSPVLMGVLIDQSVQVDAMAGAFVIEAMAASLLALAALRIAVQPVFESAEA